jgi:hypothetical protein
MADAPSDSTKAEEPKSFIDKIGPALAVGLTALAAVFGSMSAAALQQAMYWKSQAAQDQSKSTNQWSLAGFKRDRALIMQTSAALLRAQSEFRLATFTLPKSAEGDAAQQKALGWLTEESGEKAFPPRVSLPEVKDEKINDLRAAIEQRAPEGEQLAKAAKVPMAAINKAIDDAEKFVEQTDKDWDPVVSAAAKIVQMQTVPKDASPDAEVRKRALNATAATAAGYELEQRRYRAESRLNQGIGFLYDIRVKVSTAESDKHRRKSVSLGYAMLVAQIGAVAASLALSRRKGFSMWLVAGLIGVVAIGFGGYAFVPMLGAF